MIIDTTMIWRWITGVLLPIINMIVLPYMILQQLRYRPLLAYAEKLMKQWGTMMGNKHGESRERQKLTETQLSSRNKLAQVIRNKVPFNMLKNHNDAEIISLLADEELMKGAMFLGQTGSVFIKKITSVLTPGERKSVGIDKIKLMQ